MNINIYRYIGYRHIYGDDWAMVQMAFDQGWGIACSAWITRLHASCGGPKGSTFETVWINGDDERCSSLFIIGWFRS